MTEQRASVGDHSVVVQNTGDGVTILIGTSSLALVRRHWSKVEPKDEIQLLWTELRATDLVGRDGDLAALEAWLHDPVPVAVRCLIGPGGAGKTRVGIELCERAEAAGWVAGFASQPEVQRFHEAKSPVAWRWGKPTLIVIDYAAASARVLRPWLEELARRPVVPGEGPLRLLLLERHAHTQLGWWADLIRFGGMSGRGPRDLAAPAEPVSLTPLDAVAARRALLCQTVARAAAIMRKPEPAVPAAGEDPAFDAHLAAAARDTEPLFLMMAGVVGVSTGLPHALSLGRTDLAELLAGSEAARLERLSVAWGIDTDHSAPILLHLAACVTLQGGVDRAGALALIRAERMAMEFPGTPNAETVAARMAEALYREGGGADAVRPDIVGEEFVLRELARSVGEQAGIVVRAWRRDEAGTVGSVIRCAQDFAVDGEDHASLGWLDGLMAGGDDLGSLMRISDAMPQQTLVLRDRAWALQAAIADALNDLTADRPELSAARSRALGNLGVRLSTLGRREDALAAAEEAVGLRRTLAAQRPDAFRPDLATSLMVLAGVLDGLARAEEAVAANVEAIATLTDHFVRMPPAFAQSMGAMARDYLERCEKLDREPDMALLAPVLAVFGRMQGQQGDQE